MWFNEIIDVASNCDDKKEPLIKAYYYAILLSLPTRTLTEQEQSLNSLINTITQIAYHNYQFVLPLQTIVINFFAQKISCTEDDWQLLSKMLEVVQKDPSGFISPNHLNNQFKIYLKIGKKEALLNAHQFVKNNITKIAEKYQENINAFFNAYIEFESAHFDKTKVYLGQIYTININYDTQRYRLGIKCYYELNDDAIHSWIDAFSAFLTDNEIKGKINKVKSLQNRSFKNYAVKINKLKEEKSKSKRHSF
ncbi:MAG: hypothetical protein IPN94_26215 [Sphingobacteriales bacterium]|nr:hypothetical protein [Sphingobacteriales bacterium]